MGMARIDQTRVVFAAGDEEDFRTAVEEAGHGEDFRTAVEAAGHEEDFHTAVEAAGAVERIISVFNGVIAPIEIFTNKDVLRWFFER
jgi:hypothetical protein